MALWVTFEDGKKGCVIPEEGIPHEDTIAKFEKSVKVESLPYPASPVLNRAPGQCPPFCYTPEQCVGRSCCPKDYACSE